MNFNKNNSKKTTIMLGWFLVAVSLISYGVLFFGGAKGIVFLVLFVVNTFVLISGIQFIKGNHKYK